MPAKRYIPSKLEHYDVKNARDCFLYIDSYDSRF